MKISLAYGREGLVAEVPDANLVKVLRMRDNPALSNPDAATREKISRPTGSPSLSDLARGKQSACIVISDITRPVPNAVILPPILETLESAGIRRDSITILNATGIHRPNEGAELVALLGPDIPKRYRVINHMGRDLDSHTYLGETPVFKAPVYVDTRYIEADLKIVTGLIEPHLMAGFSGGRKAVMPGICAFDTVSVLHGAEAMGHERGIEGVIGGNPVHDEMLYVAKLAGIDFMVNVTLNERREITGVFAGDLECAHEEGVAFMRTQCGDSVDKPVDVVVTTSAGYPLDLTFYQTVKGITAAQWIVREGGVIIIAAKLAEGIGSPEFTNLVLETERTADFLGDIEKPGYQVLDQWQFQKFCLVLEKNIDVWLYSDGIDKETQKQLFVTPLDSIEAGIAKAIGQFGPGVRIAVIPEGPYVLAECR